MADISKIAIKGASGYCCSDEAYNDKITITPESISYEYTPFLESEMNPKRKWSYKTNSPIFKMKFDHIAKMIPEIIERGIDKFCTDIGGIELILRMRTKLSLRKYIGFQAIILMNCLE